MEEPAGPSDGAGRREAAAPRQIMSGGQPNGDVLTWYLKISKLALALAVIGRRPPGKSSREHAEHLARNLCHEEVNWKRKAEAWKAEVLHLRQELLLSRMRSMPGLPSGIGDKSVSSLETPCQDSLISKNDFCHLEDSGCDLTNGQGSADTQDLLVNHGLGHLNAYLLTGKEAMVSPDATLISAGSNPAKKEESQEKEKMLRLHTQFLQSLIRIKKLTADRTLTAASLLPGSDCSVVTDSVSQVAESLLAFCQKPRYPLSASLLMEVTQTLVCLMDDATLPKMVLAHCMKRVEELMKKFIKVLLVNSEVNRFQEQELRADILIVFGQCQLLRNQVFAALLSGINAFADDLWQIHQNQTGFDVSAYENIYYLFWVFEQLLQHKKPEESGVSIIDCAEQKHFQQRLDKTILHLADDFPLFAVYMWRLGVLLNTPSQS
eukprot:gi/632933752/ref/XP_007886476.1/ PREDICTED: meiosis-specific protein MEI4-like [Callorhinchus milii]